MRKFNYIGNFKNDSILIGNQDDVRIRIQGAFDLSGLIYCNRHYVELFVLGSGTLSLRGVCKKLIIKQVNGDCSINLTALKIQEFSCENASENSVIRADVVRVISNVNLKDNAIFYYSIKSFLTGFTLSDNAQIHKINH